MAMQRPNVLVYQEYANLTVLPDTPDLDVLVVGEAYQILDYLDDKEDCLGATAYGTEDGTIPLVGTDNYTTPVAVTFANPPNIVAGAVVDADSVRVFFDDARAVITEDDATNHGNYALGDNLFDTITALGGSGIHMGVAGVLPGDILYTQQLAGVAADYKRTVRELCYTFFDSGGGLDFVTNGVAPGDSMVIVNDVAGTSRDGTYTVKRVIDNTTLEVEEAIPGVGNIAAAQNCDTSIYAPSGTLRVTAAANALYDFCNLRVTQDFPAASGATEKWRIERTLSDVELDSTDFTVTGNQVVLNSGITTDIGTTTHGVSYAEIYIEYKALRTDLQEIQTFSDTSEMATELVKLDARNPLYVGAYVAKLNTTTRVKVYGLGDFATEELAYLDFIDRISAERNIYAIVPLTYNTTVLAALKSMAENMADPNYALTNGIRQKFRAILGAVDLLTEKTIVDVTGGATTAAVPGTAPPVTPTNDDYLTMTVSGAAVPNFNTAKVLPGDIVRFKLWNGAALVTFDYTVAHVNGNAVLEVDVRSSEPALQRSLPVWGAGPNTWNDWLPAGYLYANATETFQVIDGTDGVTPKVDLTPGIGNLTLAAATLDAYYLDLQVTGATFITDGVMAGDTLQIPVNCESNPSDWESATLQEWEINTVLSEERIQIYNNGSNTSTVSNELPHFFQRALVDGLIDVVTAGSVFFRIVRDMDKTQQVDTMVSTASSFDSKRLVLAYPNLVDVSGLVDGSLARYGSSTPAQADPQPGYYLACAIGGQTAGQPSQQGFTNLGIAGISKLYGSSEYFSEKQLTDLSNGGVYVFVQDNPASLPYSIHELTTDTLALETGEYMVVKNFDYISWTLLDTLFPFLGTWNVTPEAIDFVRQAIKTTIDSLKSRYVARIGPPLIDAVIDSVAESDLSTDRIEAYVSVDIPMVLNTIGLHLVA